MKIKAFNFISLAVVVAFNQVSFCFNINTATVLLPHTSFGYDPVVFTLKISGEGGCFAFSNSRDDLIQVYPKHTDGANFDKNCVEEVYVMPISNLTTRETSIVTFTEIIRGISVLTAHVILTTIVRLEVLTRTKLLFVGDVNEKFEVIAYDFHNNIFNSLTGIKFEWSVRCLSEKHCKGNSPISLVQFASSNFEVDKVILDLESKGFRGSMVLLEPLSQGDVILSVRCLDPAYSSIRTEVKLTVREYILLLPNENIYQIVGSSISFKAFRKVKGQLSEINIPSASYFINSSNTSVGYLQNDGRVMLAKSTGTTVISIVDKRDTFVSTGPNSFPVLVRVVDPTHASLYSEKQQNWIFQINQVYNVGLNLFYNDRILNVTDLTFDVDFRVYSNISEIRHKPNKLFCEVNALALGSFELLASLTGYKTNSGLNRTFQPPLIASALIQIVNPIIISKEIVVFPYFSKDSAHNGVFLNATGGTGKYIWYSQPKSNIKINSLGFISSFETLGTFTIICQDEMSKFITAQTVVKVLKISSISLSTTTYEVPIDSKLIININIFVFDQEQNREINATHRYPLPFSLTFSNPGVFKTYGNEPYYSSSLHLIGSFVGVTDIIVSLSDGSFSKSTSLKISCFKPLSLVMPPTISIPGSLAYVKITDGPVYYSQQKNKYPFLEVSYASTHFKSLAINQEYDSSKITTLKFQCIKPGSQSIGINVKSQVSPDANFKNSLNITLKCFKPKKIWIKPLSEHRSSVCATTNTLYLSRGKNYIPFLLGFSNDKIIYDISTLKINIFSHPWRKFDAKSNYVVSPVVHGKESDQSQTGILNLNTVFFGDYKIYLNITQKEAPFYNFKTSFNVKIARNISSSSSRIVILNHALNSKRVSIYGGSGFFDSSVSSTKIHVAAVGHSILSISPSSLGYSVITIKDLCSPNTPSLSIDVYVTTIAHMSVIYPKKLMSGASGVLKVYIFNNFNELIPLEEGNFINIQFRYLTSSRLNIDPLINEKSDAFTFSIKSGEPSIINFAIDATADNVSIIQENIEIEIFDPIEIIPRSSNMFPGLTIRLMTKGGPSTDSYLKFVVDSENLKIVNTNELIALKEGVSNVSAVSYYLNTTSGTTVIYTNQTISVTVSPITRVGISLSNNKFYENSQVIASVDIYNSLGLIKGPFKLPSDLQIVWNVEDPSVLSITHNFTSENNKQYLIFVTNKYGTSSLFLRVYTNDHQYNSSLLIHVIEQFSLSSCKNKLLLPTNIDYKLVNMWRGMQINYHLINSLNKDFFLDNFKGILKTPKFSSYTVVFAELTNSKRDSAVIQQVDQLYVEVSSIGMVYILPESEPNAKISQQKTEYSLGLVIKFRIYVLDTFGRMFDYFPSSILNFTVYPTGILEFLDQTSSMISFRAINIGTAVVNARYTTDSSIGNIFSVSIRSPSNYTSVKLVLLQTYYINVFFDESLDIKWVVKNPDVVKLFPSGNSALVMAHSVGETVISVIVTNITFPVSNFIVSHPRTINFVKRNDDAISDFDTFSTHVNLESVSYEGPSLNNISFNSYPFSCLIEPSTHPIHFTASPSFDPITRRPSCLIKKNILMNERKPFEKKSITLKACIISSFGDEKNDFCTSRDINFIPRFVIEHPTLSDNYLNVNKEKYDKIKINVRSTKDILETRCDLDCVQVTQIRGRVPGSTDFQILILLDFTRCRDLPAPIRTGFHVVRRSTHQNETINLLFQLLSDEYLKSESETSNDRLKNLLLPFSMAIFIIVICLFRNFFKTNPPIDVTNLSTNSMASKTVNLINLSNSLNDEKDFSENLYVNKRHRRVLA